MASKRGRKLGSGGRRKYYKPLPVEVKFRHRLFDGTPTHKLLHYLHGSDKLPKDVLSITETAEKLHQVREMLEEVQKDNGVGDVSEAVGRKFPKIMALVDGRTVELIKGFMIEARKVLVIKTTKEPEEG